MKKLIFGFATLAVLVPFSASTHSEVVRVPVGEQAESDVSEKPRKGVSKASVEQQFGTPISRHGPVGSPAIFYWEYDGFTVYFEDDYVIHAVSKIKSGTPFPG